MVLGAPLMSLSLNPSILLATLMAAGLASVFHLWTGRSLRDLLLFLFAAATGFGLGQWAGISLQWGILRVGELFLLEATVASVLALIVVRILIDQPA